MKVINQNKYFYEKQKSLLHIYNTIKEKKNRLKFLTRNNILGAINLKSLSKHYFPLFRFEILKRLTLIFDKANKIIEDV